MARYKGTQASHLYEKPMHTLCTITEQPLLADTSTILDRSLSHLRTFSDNGIVFNLLDLSIYLPISDCFDLVEPSHADLVCQGDADSMNCTVTCHEGHMLPNPDRHTVVCNPQTDHVWSHVSDFNPDGKLTPCSGEYHVTVYWP